MPIELITQESNIRGGFLLDIGTKTVSPLSQSIEHGSNLISILQSIRLRLPSMYIQGQLVFPQVLGERDARQPRDLGILGLKVSPVLQQKLLGCAYNIIVSSVAMETDWRPGHTVFRVAAGDQIQVAVDKQRVQHLRQLLSCDLICTFATNRH